MQNITAQSNVEDTLKRIGVGVGEKLRESEKRRTTLEKFAQLRSRSPQTSLNIRNAPTAYVTLDDDGIDEFTNIVIPKRQFDQNMYNFPEEYHDYLIQKGMTIHEVGHILYSSYPALKEYTRKVSEQEDYDEQIYVTLFQNIYNILEDGAIEKFLSENYRVDEELYYMRSVLHDDTYMGEKIELNEKTQYQYPFIFALMTALLNIAVYDNHELEKLMDVNNDKHVFAIEGQKQMRKNLEKCLPKIREYAPQIQREKDAQIRTRLSYKLWKELRVYLDRSETPGKREMQRRQKMQIESDSYGKGVPSNLSEAYDEQQREPSGGGDSDENAGASTIGDKRRQMREQSENIDIGEKARKEVRQESMEQAGDIEHEIEEIIDSLGAGDGTEEIYIPEDGEVDTFRKNEAERHGERCAKIFKNRLKQERRDKTIKKKKRGEWDSSRMIAASRGSPRIFKQIKEGEKKNYSCMIVCDRSSSMSNRIDEVELAAGAVAYGLEAVGVDSSILETYQSKTAIAKPFGGKIDNFREKVFAGRCSGGTPLQYTLQFARERINRGHGDVPFMIVITDGRPKEPGIVKEEIRNAQFPVLGMYLTNNEDKERVKEQMELYDRAIAVNTDESVSHYLLNLIKSVFF